MQGPKGKIGRKGHDGFKGLKVRIYTIRSTLNWAYLKLSIFHRVCEAIKEARG